MSYSDYLIQLLKPLGVYDFEDGSYNVCELQAIGAALDDCCGTAEELERECVVTSAEDYGLSMYEEILPETYGTDAETRRAAIISMLSINNQHLSKTQLNTILSGCGTRAEVEETANVNEVRVIFPDILGEPENAAELKTWIESILPCHLKVIYAYEES
jgi:hypothetical protein